MKRTLQEFKEKRIKELEALKERGTTNISYPMEGESFSIDEALELYNSLPPKDESWDEFCARIGIGGDEDLAVFMHFTSVFVYEQSLNWRKQVVKYRKLIDAIPKKEPIEVTTEDNDPEESRNP